MRLKPQGRWGASCWGVPLCTKSIHWGTWCFHSLSNSPLFPFGFILLLHMLKSLSAQVSQITSRILRISIQSESSVWIVFISPIYKRYFSLSQCMWSLHDPSREWSWEALGIWGHGGETEPEEEKTEVFCLNARAFGSSLAEVFHPRPGLRHSPQHSEPLPSPVSAVLHSPEG